MGNAHTAAPPVVNKGRKVVKGVTYDSETGEITDCIFCNIRDKREPANILLENEEFVVFKTIKPAVPTLHALVCPKKHVQSLASLRGKSGADLVRRMVDTGKDTLRQQGMDVDDVQFCFHVPPYNSIDHLHLHVIATPRQMSLKNMIKYFPSTYWCQQAMQVIRDLERPRIKRSARE